MLRKHKHKISGRTIMKEDLLNGKNELPHRKLKHERHTGNQMA